MDLSDLSAAARAVAQGRASAERLLDEALAAARGPAARHAFLQLREADARAAAQRADAAVATGADPGALAGLAVSIKDLFDIAGDVTAAGSLALADTAPAAADAPVVARLRAAGAALIGRTNMTEFAFSGIGLNPHFDTPANVAMAALDSEPRIPGGSSSGAAVSVACGAAWAALGSDTGGSIRIPAAFHGLVGFKNTQALTPSAGSVPLAPSLDTACAITRSVRDAVRVHEVLAQRRVPLARRPLASLKLAVIATPFLDALEPPVAAAFEQALRTLSAQGASVRSHAVPALAQLADLQSGGGLAAAESYAWHQPLLARRGAQYDPRVRTRIERGAALTADDVTRLHTARAQWIGATGAALAGFDAVVSPTVPVIAPPIAPLRASDDAFFRANALVLRNPSVVNLLDGCAISLPCHAAGRAPVGLMLWHTGGHDDALLDAALAIEQALAPVTKGHA